MSNNAFPPTSRYYAVGTTSRQTADGKTIVYLNRRFVPQSDKFAVLMTYTVVEGDRVDTVAAEFIGDPEQFWRVCDANNVLQPEELTRTPGANVNITLPEGIPAPTNA